MDKIVYIFDLDDTILDSRSYRLTQTHIHYEDIKPIKKLIQLFNKLSTFGDIFIYTNGTEFHAIESLYALQLSEFIKGIFLTSTMGTSCKLKLGKV